MWSFGLSFLLITGAHAIQGQINVPPLQEDVYSCLNKKSLKFVLSGSCSYDQFKNAIETKMATHLSCGRSNLDNEIMAILGVNSMHDASRKFDELCKDAIVDSMQNRDIFDFESFSNMDHDFNKAFFDGGSSWIDGGMPARKAQVLQNLPPSLSSSASSKFRGNSQRLNSIFQRVAHKRPISWPDNIENFRHCAANAAMCCWVDYDELLGTQYARNTDLCYVDYSRAQSSSHMEVGLGLFGGMQDAYCHGFAWESGSLGDLFKGNLLFLSEIYDNMHNKGLSKNVAGAPMCGCIEQMPIVTRADCSTLEWNGNFIFRHTYMPVNTNMIKVTGQTTINVVHCDGANGISNDLQMHYEKLFLDGRVNATQKALFEETLIGEHDCTSAMQDIMSHHMPSMNSTAIPSTYEYWPSKFSSYPPTDNSTNSFPSSNTTVAVPNLSPSPKPTVTLPTNTAPGNSCPRNARWVKIESTTGESVQMFEMQLYSGGVNIAQNGVASQSTSHRPASNAIDGDVTTFSHTLGTDLNGWWSLDLNEDRSLDHLTIINRWCVSPNDPNSCYCRLSNAIVTLVDESGSVVHSQLLGNTCSAAKIDLDLTSCDNATAISPSASPISACPVNAQQIKVESTTSQPVQMFELRLYSSGVDIAQNGVASQSTSHRPASNAIDGDVTTFSHTLGTDLNGWWSLNLNEVRSLDHLTIINRWCVSPNDPNSCYCRLSNSKLSFLDENGQVVSVHMLGDTCNVAKIDLDLTSCDDSSVQPTSASPSSHSASSSPSGLRAKFSKLPTSSSIPTPVVTPSTTNTEEDVIIIQPTNPTDTVPNLSPSPKPTVTLPTSSSILEPVVTPILTPAVTPPTTNTEEDVIMIIIPPTDQDPMLLDTTSQTQSIAPSNPSSSSSNPSVQLSSVPSKSPSIISSPTSFSSESSPPFEE